MDKLKTWVVEVFIKKLGPSFLRSGIASLGVVLAAHAGLLTAMGITYDAVKHVISVDLNVLSDWLIFAGPGGLTAFLALVQHHTVAAVAGAPQSGDLRKDLDKPMVDGNRSTDPPKGA